MNATDDHEEDAGDEEDADADVGNDVNPVLVQANLTKEQQKQLIAQMLTEVPLIDGWDFHHFVFVSV